MLGRLISAIAVLALAGCAAEVPLASPEMSAAAQAFQAPPPGQSALYVFRQGQFASSYLLDARIDSRQLGPLAADTWFRIDMEPGAHVAGCSTSESSQRIQVQLVPGEIRFVEIGANLGWSAPRCSISEATSDKGKAAVRNGRQALPLN